MLVGKQQVRKFNRTSPDNVRILMAIYRVESKNVDLVLTLNAPATAADGAALDEAGWQAVKSAFETTSRSLKIIDFGLFA